MNHLEKVNKFLHNHKLDVLLVNKPENRRYISGFTGSSAWLVLSANRNLLVTDFRYIEQAAKQAPQFEIIRHGNNQLETVADYIKRFDSQNVGFEADFITYETYNALSELLPNAKFIPIKLDEIRMVKDNEEIKNIKRAAEITDSAFAHILKIIRPGMTEKDIAIEMEFFMRRQGADDLAFETIVASGIRSSLPHGRATDKPIESGDFITMDFGAKFKGYCSDMTRTIVMGKASEKQREIYHIVLNAQLAGLKAVAAGKKGKEVDAVAREIITKAGYGEYFGHGLGHSLGLAIHEDPRLSLTGEIVLENNMVVTVEPGIYLPDWGGVRIEDTVVVTSTGVDILTSSSKELIELHM